MLEIIDELQNQWELKKFWDNGCIKSQTIDMVMSMLSFTRYVRSADWNQPLKTSQNISLQWTYKTTQPCVRGT